MPNKPKHIFQAQLDIVHGCQLQCVGCPNSVLLPKVERISVEDFGLCLSNIDVERINTLRLFNFGEPLLHKEISQIVALIPKQKWRASVVEISTNAQWVDWDEFERMMKLEIVNRLVVSCDGDGTPEAYESLRPPSKWSKFIEFLERAAALRDKWAPATQLLTRSIVREHSDMKRWNQILLPRGWTPEFRRWMALPESRENMTGRVSMAPKGPCVYFAEPSDYVAHPWFGEIHMLSMDADGTVVPCCMHPKAGNFGNLKTQKFSEIRHGQARRDMLDAMKTNRGAMSVCGTCEIGPVGNEGPSYWSAVAYWSAAKDDLLEKSVG